MFNKIILVLLLLIVTINESPATETKQRIVIVYENVDFYLEVDPDTTIFLMSTTGICELGLRSAYVYAPLTGNYTGCWIQDKDYIDIIWSEGTKDKIPKKEFTRVLHVPLRSA